MQALTDPAQKNNRDHVDIIIALGMAKEGFDWIWCEHALTVGYRASLTEIVQIIGRTTRDAPGKHRARFTNLIAELDASEASVTEAVNDTLKAIAASLLMEQVLAPRFEFRPKAAGTGPTEGIDYGPDGYQEGKTNIGVDPKTGQVEIEIAGLKQPQSAEAQRICKEDLTEVISSFVQDKETIERGVFDPNQVPQDPTQVGMAKIIKARFPDLSEDDQEAVRQHAIAAMNIAQKAWKLTQDTEPEPVELDLDEISTPAAEFRANANTAFVTGVRRFAMDVRELDLDLIDSINPFGEAYSILSKTMDEKSLRTIESVISAKRLNISPDEARDLAIRAVQFKKDRNRDPSERSNDPWEQRLAAGATAFMRYLHAGRYNDQ